jgi:hypothetical protein
MGSMHINDVGFLASSRLQTNHLPAYCAVATAQRFDLLILCQSYVQFLNTVHDISTIKMGSPQVQPLGLVNEGKPARSLGYDAWNFSPKVDTLDIELEVTNL